jgi:glycosyltransferase involved in cell wall biosynthesis
MIDKSINYYKKKLIIIIIIFFVNKLLFKVLFYKNIKIFEYLQFLLESKKIEYFLKSLNALKIKPINYNNINYLPKISIISPIYNSEKYLLRFLNCLENQNFHKIEIIIIDDSSIDNSVKIIEKYKVKDKRIVLLKNKYNKGTFITRNLGIIYSKGKYIIAPDPDDILSKNIIASCFKYAEKYDYEMIRFNVYIGKKKLVMKDYVNKLAKKEVFQPELSTYDFYGIDELMMIDFNVYNKFVKKEVYIRALYIIQKYIYRL